MSKIFFQGVHLLHITADCARFLYQDETAIEAPVWRAQSAVMHIYNIFIINFSGARVCVREFAQFSCRLTSLIISVIKFHNSIKSILISL